MAMCIKEVRKFQCPRGHFCFSDRAAACESSTCPLQVSMPARAFLLFGHGSLPRYWWRNFGVSMPARAFLLFGRSPRLISNGSSNSLFQCPRGHFCFSDLDGRGRARVAGHRFNAREGIFAFRTARVRCHGAGSELRRFNAREGIFAFRTIAEARERGEAAISFNAREGIFAFRTIGCTRRAASAFPVSMPARAFLLFGRARQARSPQRAILFQCPRGHFCFSDSSRYTRRPRTGTCAFQCPRGHFCFSDFYLRGDYCALCSQFQCPRGHFCFSDNCVTTRTLT